MGGIICWHSTSQRNRTTKMNSFNFLLIYFQTYLFVFLTFPSDISFIDHLLSTYFVCLIFTQGYVYVFKIDFTEYGRGKERREGGRKGRNRGREGEGEEEGRGREKGEGREGETSVIEKHHQGSNLQPEYVPWLGNKPTTFWDMGQCSNQVSLGQAHFNMPGTNLKDFTIWREEFVFTEEIISLLKNISIFLETLHLSILTPISLWFIPYCYLCSFLLAHWKLLCLPNKLPLLLVSPTAIWLPYSPFGNCSKITKDYLLKKSSFSSTTIHYWIPMLLLLPP